AKGDARNRRRRARGTFADVEQRAMERAATRCRPHKGWRGAGIGRRSLPSCSAFVQRRASGEGIVYSAIPVKVWVERLPSAEQVRPGCCSRCGAASQPLGGRLGLQGHGLRWRQVRGPASATGEPETVLVPVRRYHCQRCGGITTVLPGGLCARRHYSASAIGLALCLFGLMGRTVGETRAHLDLLAPLANAIHDKTRGAGLMATDATGIRILDPQAPEGIRSGTMWGWTNALWVSFFYCASGDADGVKRFLGEGNYARTVQADGTNLLTFIERAGGKRPGCWSHARRGLVLCARSKDRVALKGAKLIAPLFAVERQSKDAGENAAQRLARRQVHSRPIIDAIFAWVEEQRAVVPPGTPLGKALGYLHRQRSRLVLFLEDGNIPLTNNRRERELRKLVLGRRNWLFTWGDDGGERIANILTIVSSCIAHGVNPREYLMVVTQALLERRPVAELLPDRIVVSHPNLCIPGFTVPELPD